MKTIEEMYQEWLRNQYANDASVSDPQILIWLRRAFFAGFNRAYNATITETEKSVFYASFSPEQRAAYEKEMDDFSDARDAGRA